MQKLFKCRCDPESSGWGCDKECFQFKDLSEDAKANALKKFTHHERNALGEPEEAVAQHLASRDDIFYYKDGEQRCEDWATELQRIADSSIITKEKKREALLFYTKAIACVAGWIPEWIK